MTYSNNTTILSVVKKIIRLILIISIISEMIFFRHGKISADV